MDNCQTCQDGDTCEKCLGNFKVSFEKTCTEDCGDSTFVKEGVC